MDPNHTDFPKGKAVDNFKNPPHSTYADMLANTAYQRDTERKRNWIYLGLVGICIITTAFIAATANYKTYVVRVDQATGQVETGGQLKATNYTPQQAELKYYLANFIRNTRTVPLDPVQYRVNWENASHFMTQEASNKLMEFTSKDNPSSKLGKATVQPTITSIQLYPGTKNTYQVRWFEEEYNLSGNSTQKKRNYVGLFMLTVVQPTKESELLINPLGITIKDLTMSGENLAQGGE